MWINHRSQPLWLMDADAELGERCGTGFGRGVGVGRGPLTVAVAVAVGVCSRSRCRRWGGCSQVVNSVLGMEMKAVSLLSP